MRREIRIEVTNACNAKCIMCPREKMTRKVGIMNMKTYKRIIDECEQLNIKLISLENFGESFLDPTLKEKIIYAKQKNMYIMTITNGSLIKNNLDVALLFDKIRISLIGNKFVHAKVQKNLNYDEIVNGILKLKQSTPRPIIELSNIVLYQSPADIELWIKTWEKIVDKLSVWKPHNWIDGRKYRELNTVPLKTCGRPKNGPIQIQWNGDFVPCCFDFNSELILGNIENNSIKEVLNGISYRKLIEGHDSGKFPSVCLKCDQLRSHENVCIYSSDGSHGSHKTSTFGLQLN